MAMHPINPATGLPMTCDDFSGVDVGGSPWGTDTHAYHNPWSAFNPAWNDGGWDRF